MRTTRSFLASGALLLLTTVPIVLAHGHDASDASMSSSMSMGHGTHGGNMSAPSAPAKDAPPSYFNHPEHSGLMMAHIILMSISWIMVLPVAVMFSIARSRLTALAQIAFLVLNGLGVFTSILYDAQTPDLYENNAHHKLGWVLNWFVAAWVFFSLITIYSKGKASKGSRLQPILTGGMGEYQSLTQQTPTTADYRWSHDSGHGTESNSDSPHLASRSNSWQSENGQLPMRKAFQDNEGDSQDADAEKQPYLAASTKVDRFLSRAGAHFASSRLLFVFNLGKGLFDRTLLQLGFIAMLSGIVTYGGIARGSAIFSVLAHFIKGGIFFWYGLLSLGKWMGAFADFGWAWNMKPPVEVVGARKASVYSSEWWESFLIFFYGATNVWLEHLNNWGKDFSPMDLEHISITILFFGGGLLGMLVESSRVRKLMTGALLPSDAAVANTRSEWQAPQSYSHPMNPLPGLIIMLLGIMMSSHAQHHPVSAAIHKQWGMLFVAAALARGTTYVTLWLKPPTSYLPSRPPSELITAFCLISGGAIFMASNSDTVNAVIGYDLDAMFIFTVVMGFTGVLMSWTVIVVAIKTWASPKDAPRDLPLRNSESAA